MLKKCLMVTFVLLGFTTLVFPQNFATPESPSSQGISNILGSGARALGMGGAFIAVADDATAASWNPAGLAQLTKPEASIVYDYFSGNLNSSWDYEESFPYEDRTLTWSGSESWQEGQLSYTNISFASATYPFTIKDRHFVIQFSYQRLSTFPAFNASWFEDWTLTDNYNYLYQYEIYDQKSKSEYTGESMPSRSAWPRNSLPISGSVSR